MVDAPHVQVGEIVGQAVVSEVVAERPFGLELARADFAQDSEVGVGVDWQRPVLLRGQPQAAPA